MLEFTARHGIKPTIETFPMSDASAALDHTRQGKARFRSVLVAKDKSARLLLGAATEEDSL